MMYRRIRDLREDKDLTQQQMGDVLYSVPEHIAIMNVEM